MTTEPIKFAYWVPNVSGGLVISNVEQRTSWTPEYNRKLAKIAEASGFDYALSQIRFTAGYGADNQHESLSFTHDLLAHTGTLKVIAAVLPGPWNPALLSKQIATITHLVGPRVAVVAQRPVRDIRFGSRPKDVIGGAVQAHEFPSPIRLDAGFGSEAMRLHAIVHP